MRHVQSRSTVGDMACFGLELAFCIISPIYGSSFQSEYTKSVVIYTEPDERSAIFRAQTATKEQCLYVCIQNDACVLAAYNGAGLSCYGYRTKDTSSELLGEDVIAWRIIKGGKCLCVLRCISIINCSLASLPAIYPLLFEVIYFRNGISHRREIQPVIYFEFL